MLRWNLIPLLCGLLASLWAAPGCGQERDLSLTDVLRALPADRPLEFTLGADSVIHASFIQVHDDTLLVQRQDASGRPGPLTQHALSDVARVREWRSNVNRGAGWGAASGGVILGGFGVLVGLYAAGVNSPAASDVAPVVAGGLAGAAIGALAGATLGGGVGALVYSWHEIWPTADQRREDQVVPAERNWTPAPTRLGLFAGFGRTTRLASDVTRPTGRVSLRQNWGRTMRVGPEFGYYDFGGHVVSRTSDLTGADTTENLAHFGVALDLHARSPGLAPFLTIGLGWYLHDDAYAGAHAGGGLRWQYSHGHDLELELRYHFNLTDVDSPFFGRFWTLGLGLGFTI